MKSDSEDLSISKGDFLFSKSAQSNHKSFRTQQPGRERLDLQLFLQNVRSSLEIGLKIQEVMRQFEQKLHD